jgi:hypothetical protein
MYKSGNRLVLISVVLFLFDAFHRDPTGYLVSGAWLAMLIGGTFFVLNVLGIKLVTVDSAAHKN